MTISPTAVSDVQGAGMFSKNARDAFRIAMLVGGFDQQEVVLRCFMRGTGEHVNLPTLERVLQEISDKQKEAE